MIHHSATSLIQTLSVGASEWITPFIQGPKYWGSSFLLQGAPGTQEQHPVSEESEKGGGSRHKWRKFIPALPLTLWSVQSVLLTQCTMLFSTSLEFSILPLKSCNHWTDTPCVNLFPGLGSTLLFSASLNFPFDMAGKWNCSVFVLLRLAYFALTNSFPLCFKWQDCLHF